MPAGHKHKGVIQLPPSKLAFPHLLWHFSTLWSTIFVCVTFVYIYLTCSVAGVRSHEIYYVQEGNKEEICSAEYKAALRLIHCFNLTVNRQNGCDDNGGFVITAQGYLLWTTLIWGLNKWPLQGCFCSECQEKEDMKWKAACSKWNCF